jgi:glutamate dehydrogenase/leucine dehydrogenase
MDLVTESPGDVFARARVEGFEQVVFAADENTGLRAIVAIHSTALGPSLGGTRFKAYPSEHDALVDVCRLARGMTYKHAVCGNDLGGGKAVILGDPATTRSDALLRAYAVAVDRIGGRYLTAEDVGTTQADMDLIRAVTPHVTGTSEHLGGSGDPSPATAWGVVHAMHAVAARRWGDRSLAGRHVVVSGVGKVGSALVRHLVEAGARVTASDVRRDAVDALERELGVSAVDPARAHTVDCDVFSPCALGAVLSETTIPELRCDAVCGCANNQLADEADGDRLAAAKILYAPDYVANAGGVINIADETSPGGYDHTRAWQRVAGIEATMLGVFARAEADGVTPAEAADRLAEDRLAASAAQSGSG